MRSEFEQYYELIVSVRYLILGALCLPIDVH
jgi:hypothetical protein